MKIIIIGIQGSGKGTQSSIIAKEFGLVHISAGDLVREEIKKCTEDGMKAKSFTESGELVPDKIIEEILFKNLPNDNFILDGYPRNIEQAKKLEKINKPDKVIFLEIKDKEIIKRLEARSHCPKCKEQYGLNRAPHKQGVCDKCGTKLEKRKDDNQESIKKRISLFYKETLPLLDFYKDRMIKVDGKGSVYEVFERIKKII